MKKIRLAIVLFSVCALPACIMDTYSEQPVRASLREATIRLDLTTGGTQLETDDETIYRVRFIIFDDASTGSPTLDINQFQVIAEPKVVDSFFAELETTLNDDKMLVVIVNEPADMTNDLNVVETPSELSELELSLSSFLTNPATASAVIAATGMPMTGVYTGFAVREHRYQYVKMTVERVVAKIAVYLQAADADAYAGYKTSSQVVIDRVYNGSYFFVRGNVDNHTWSWPSGSAGNFGEIMTASGEGQLTWTPASAQSWTFNSAYDADDPPNTRLLCEFYVPEWKFVSDGDRLEISMSDIVTSPSGHTVSLENYVLSEFTDPDGATQPFDEVRRNHVYEIVARVKYRGIDLYASAKPWNNMVVPVYDGLFHMAAYPDRVWIDYESGGSTTFRLFCDHPEGWTLEGMYEELPELTYGGEPYDDEDWDFKVYYYGSDKYVYWKRLEESSWWVTVADGGRTSDSATDPGGLLVTLSAGRGINGDRVLYLKYTSKDESMSCLIQVAQYQPGT